MGDLPKYVFSKLCALGHSSSFVYSFTIQKKKKILFSLGKECLGNSYPSHQRLKISFNLLKCVLEVVEDLEKVMVIFPQEEYKKSYNLAVV